MIRSLKFSPPSTTWAKRAFKGLSATLLRAGNDVNMISYWLGHAHINTTHIYVEIDMEMKRRMLQKAGAPAVQKSLPWQKPDILQWLNALAKGPQLCGVNG